MRGRVLLAAKQLGWRPNSIARSLQTRHTDLVGVVTADLHTPWRAFQIAALIPALQDAGMRPLVFQAPDNSDVDLLVTELASYQGRAVVIGAGQVTGNLAERFASEGVLVILVNRWMPSHGILSLVCDNVEGGRLAARHLAECGCRRIVLAGYEHSVSGQDRMAGFIEVAAELGMRTTRIDADELTIEAGERIGAMLADRMEQFDGVFCANDALALGVIDHGHLTDAYRVGRDFALIGFDGLPSAAAAAYQLTTVAQPLEETSQMVAKWLSRWKAGTIQLSPEASRRLAPSLQARRSTLAFAGAQK